MLGTPLADCCGGVQGHGANYLGPEHAGVQLSTDPASPLPFAIPGSEVYREEQAEEFALLGRLNRLTAIEYPDDPALRARIRAYELAFHMQRAVPEVVNIGAETAACQKAYGLDQNETQDLRPAMSGRSAPGRARRAVRANLSRQRRRRRRVGRPQQLASGT